MLSLVLALELVLSLVLSLSLTLGAGLSLLAASELLGACTAALGFEVYSSVRVGMLAVSGRRSSVE